MAQAEWAAMWAGLGVAATLVCAWIAERNGFLQITIAREAHGLNVFKATPKIGCDVFVGEIPHESGYLYNPHFSVTLEVYNEGELAVQSLDGAWKLSAVQGPAQLVFPIHRDFLGNREKYTHTHKIKESSNWRRDSIAFNVQIEFFYSIPGQNEKGHYNAKYHYHPKTKQMVKQRYE